jgi:hypothetical protein
MRTTRNRIVKVLLTTTLLAAPAWIHNLQANENLVRRPYAEWANLPEQGQFVISPFFGMSEAYHAWEGSTSKSIQVEVDREDYGVDVIQGSVLVEYGIADRWAADIGIGYTSVGTRSFNAGAHSESTTGLMDTTLGVRYQIHKEYESEYKWLPTVTFRAGGILPGSYEKLFPFAPGNHSAGIEPSLMMRKHLGWQGFGLYGDFLYRYLTTSGDDQYAVALGCFQEIKNWTISAGWRHFQCLSGYDLVINVGEPLDYAPQAREITDTLEVGFSYRTPKRHFVYAFDIKKVFDGSNTDSAFYLGAHADFPIGGKGK